ncbi:MAG: hypothetical protein IPL58_16710 [Betaproteobacteria bacterium]|uniref:Uncharacterized protein n=1 Tax=Candidatus Proximibacter danicus TaxID=2954365 RepID=A0A9D7PRQ6_9PROT|nr:hypothetical protein [Candidatus Proximibacter danicus]
MSACPARNRPPVLSALSVARTTRFPADWIWPLRLSSWRVLSAISASLTIQAAGGVGQGESATTAKGPPAPRKPAALLKHRRRL